MTHNAPIYLRPQVRVENGKGTMSFTLGSKPMAVRRGTFDSPGGGIGSAAEMPSQFVQQAVHCWHFRVYVWGSVSCVFPSVEDVKVVMKVPVTTTGIEWNANVGVVAFDVKVHVSPHCMGQCCFRSCSCCCRLPAQVVPCDF
jgi:hypothetical protein